MPDNFHSFTLAMPYQLLGTSLILCVCSATFLPYVAACAGPTSNFVVNRQSVSTYGTVPIKDTDYAIPAQAYFVSRDGDDSNPGTEAAPFATIQKAVMTVPADSTIVIRAGIYHEAIDIYGKALSLQPYPHERVVLDGAIVVSDWTPDGSLWRKDGWYHLFQQGGLPADAIDSSYPLAGYPDMVFVDGQPLEQVADKSQVGARKFYVDYTNKSLYISEDPNGKLVEAAALAQAINIDNAPGTIVRGLGFIRYATHRDQYGAVKGDSDHQTFENNTFAWNAAAGLSIFEPDDVVRGNLFIYNGQIGLLGYKTDRLLLEQNTVASNNQEHFNVSWEAGGIKVSEAHDMIWRDNLVESNLGKGMWDDGSCFNTTIVRNVIRNNSDHGISYEISAKALIASNLVVNNGGSGILILESEDVRIYNNTLSMNQQNIRILEGDRINPANSSITWNVRDVVIKNNILSNGDALDRVLLGVDDTQEQKSAEQMGITADYDVYYRASSNLSSTLTLWSQWPDGVAHFATFDAFRSTAGQEINGLGIDNVPTNPFFVDETNGDYSLKAGSPAIGSGEPLPQDIANAIGVIAGLPVNRGALKAELCSTPMDIPMTNTSTAGLTSTSTPTEMPTSKCGDIYMPVVISQSAYP